ncbi:MAG: M13 family metallopeptidase [Sphingomonas sp.]
MPAVALQTDPGAPAAGRAKFGPWGIDLKARDLDARPGDDFYAYANRSWFRANPIPADRTSWGINAALSQEVEQQLRTIVEEAQASPADPVRRQVAELYAAWMDEAAIEARGTAVLRPYLSRIAAARNRDDLIRIMATPGFPSLVFVGMTPNPMNPTRYAALVGQGGLGMPSRDHYLREGDQYDRYRAAYRTYVTTLLRLAGFDRPDARADAIIALERRIAEAQWTPERSRDVSQTVNPMTPAQLATLAPQFNWPLWLSVQGLDGGGTIIVRETTAIAAEAALFGELPIETWRDYLSFHFIRNYAQYLPRAFDEADFAFYGRTLRGSEQQRDRWKRGLSLLDTTLGEALGRLYVERHFPAESRRQMDELVGNIRAALADRIRANDWMDEPTRAEALAKLAAFDPRIGHPTRFIDYAPLRIARDDLLGNMVRAAAFQWRLRLARRLGPVDRGLWFLTPQTVNAYYDRITNQITFPAGILQPPYFDPNADPAVNYGSIGGVIGHEIGHGFDDQGRRFDASGRMRDWWSAQSAQRFTERAARLGAQFDTYEPFPGVRVNGRVTMGENIGDLGGLEMAYAAWRRYVDRHGEPPVRDGLTGDQRFFLAYAQSWRVHFREGELRQRLLAGVHSPPEYRVNGIVRNVDAWYRAFNIQPGDRLYLPPEQRVRIW